MADVIQFLKGFGDFFVSIGNFIVDFIEDLLYIIKATAQAVASIPDMLGWLPSGVVAAFVAIFAIVVIYKISGREG